MRMNKKEEFIIKTASIIAAVISTILLILVLLFSNLNPDKPEFLSVSEYEMVEKYISDTEEQQTALARIVDSRELSEEELRLIDEAIVALGDATKALENILKYKEN